jgi:hypothetical protein
VPVEKYGLGAELRGGAERHCRVDPEFSRFITCGGNYATLIALSAYDDRQAAQFRPSQQLDGNEERVHIDMQNRCGRIGGNLQRGIVLGAELGQLRHRNPVEQLYNGES